MIADAGEWVHALVHSGLFASGANFCELCGKRVIVDSKICWKCDAIMRERTRKAKPQNYCSTCRVKTKYGSKQCRECYKLRLPCDPS